MNKSLALDKNTERDVQIPSLIDLRSLSTVDIEEILAISERIKSGDKTYDHILKGRHFGLLFASASTRTRVSFQVGIRQMGGFVEYLNTKDLQLSNNESLKDTASILGKYLDGLVVRMYDMNAYGKGREAIKLLIKHSKVPVINALDDKDHPCQVMADLYTLKEHLGSDFRKKKIVFSWAYADRQKSPGVPQSMLSAASIMGMDITFAYPKGFELDTDHMTDAKQAFLKSGGSLSITNNLLAASKNADVIYAKSWKSLSMTKEEDHVARRAIRNDWTISEKHFEFANPGALFMNCLPIIRGEQATKEIIDREDSILYDQAENRLHVQKAILAFLYNPKKQ